MRVPVALIALAAAVPLIGATKPAPIAAAPATKPHSDCPRTTIHVAGQTGIYRGQPLVPRKLTELPPAVGYMAVYRHIGGCEAPMTMVEYRNPRRH